MKKFRSTILIFAICCVSFLAFLAFNPSHAYFQNFTAAEGVNTAKVDLLFDKFNQGVTNGSDFTVDLTADWGTPTNPYVMTGKNHVNNLFILQKSEYFAKKVDASGTPRQSYFRVANKDGTPIVIDCDGMTINPIGSTSNPFTGNIQGAPLGVPTDMTGISEDQQKSYKYGNYSITQSAIANLNVVAIEATPDIGFFGRLGYKGTVEEVTSEKKDDKGNVIASVKTLQLTGFSANLNNLLFADITISTEQAPGTDWWSKFTDNDKPHDECGETHHLGIIAGHAEWATLTNISVYYSEDIPAFDVGKDTTNYYSIVGLLGTLSYVNPSAGDAANTVTAIGAISDEQLKEELLSGGGGEGSGMLTGYMLAENIFDRKDAGNTMTLLEGYAEAYDVKNMTEDGKKIFTEVVMPERDSFFDLSTLKEVPWTYHTYYYFADTIFTFAMSTEKDETNPDAVDYVVKIWDIDKNEDWDATDDSKKVPPPIYLTLSKDSDNNGYEDNWSYGIDETISRYAFKLQAVTAKSQLSEDGLYVLAYQTADGSIYTLDIGNSNGYARPFSPYEDVITDKDGKVLQTFKTEYFTENDTSSGIKSMYALGTDPESKNFQYAFIYKSKDTNASASKVTFTSYDKTKYFGVVSEYGSYSMSAPKIYTGLAPQSAGNPDRIIIGGGYNGYWYEWLISPLGNGKVTVTCDSTTFGNSVASRTESMRILFSKTSLQFTLQRWNPDNYDSGVTPDNTEGCDNNLLLFEVVLDNTNSGEKISESKNVAPDLDAIEHKFNPSTDVLFYDKATNGYIATPLLQKQWNNGKGQYLESLNHAVKMFQAAPSNFQLTLSNTFIGDWFGDTFDTNAGDVVLVPLGTTKINFTTPTGMIAYYVMKASPEDPSEINIIVAVNPEKAASSIGLWGPQQLDSATSNFSIDNPYDSFPLPASISATSEQDGKTYMTDISGYYTLETNPDDNSSYYKLHDEGYATYLGGKIVLVGYTFTVTEPGVYLMGSGTGPMSVCYFSVTGAAGSGGDGTGGSPLGDVDFVYDNNSDKIITVDQKFSGSHVVSGETPESLYYPSYFYIRMIPDADYNIEDGNKNDTQDGKIPSEKLYIRRYIQTTPPTLKSTNSRSDRRRLIKLVASDDDTKLLGLSAIYQDVDYDITIPVTN